MWNEPTPDQLAHFDRTFKQTSDRLDALICVHAAATSEPADHEIEMVGLGRYLLTEVDREAAAETLAVAIDRLAGAGGHLMPEPVVEYGTRMAGGGMHLRNQDPRAGKVYPLQQWLRTQLRYEGRVFRRTVVVVDDWREVPDGDAQ
jgi:hypothetical protein